MAFAIDVRDTCILSMASCVLSNVLQVVPSHGCSSSIALNRHVACFPGSCDILYTFCIATSTLVHSFQYCPELLVPWFMARAHRRRASQRRSSCEDFYHVCLINAEHGDHGVFTLYERRRLQLLGHVQICGRHLQPAVTAVLSRGLAASEMPPAVAMQVRVQVDIARCVSGTCELCLQQPELVRRTGCSNDLVLLHSLAASVDPWLVMDYVLDVWLRR
jgi:hypothetical protein